MKNLLVGLILLASLSSFAKEQKPKCIERADAVAPFRTVIFTTSNDCEKVKKTTIGFSADRAVQVISEITCQGKDYSVVRTLPMSDYDHGAVFTVETSSLIKN